MEKVLKNKDIAAKINEYYKRFEHDPKVNTITRSDGSKDTLFYNAGCYASGSHIMIWEISYQIKSSLKKEEALEFLEWLEAGNTGTIHKFKNSKGKNK